MSALHVLVLFQAVAPADSNPEWQTMLATYGSLISGIWAVLIVWREVRHLKMTAISAHYSELDRNYTEILLQAIDRPYLRDPQKIGRYVAWLKENEPHAADKTLADSSPNLSKRAREYDLYAFATMNFIEAIRDRCHESTSTHWLESPYAALIKGLKLDRFKFLLKQEDTRLVTTWRPIVAFECRLHREWFVREAATCCESGHTGKFCHGFADFVEGERWTFDAEFWGDRSKEEIDRASAKSKKA
jgi:hypothetical protein